ncbi:hypothetical protein CDAR_195241 [Caerostris darwini]|uniref:Uncharacterized protein n=1 Tax=Caerostris darwini TaxID=1538125 RepID=A0AAV4R2P1_9ARAC|nr:hypothetical protein CDAR_195241 [Caerostris darwini]
MTHNVLPIYPDHVHPKGGNFFAKHVLKRFRGKRKRKRGGQGKTGKALPTESAHGIFYRCTVNVIYISLTRFHWIRASVLNAHNGMFSTVGKKPAGSHYKPKPYNPPNFFMPYLLAQHILSMVDMHYRRKTPNMLPINPDHVHPKGGTFLPSTC